jgi:hypothetical protein
LKLKSISEINKKNWITKNTQANTQQPLGTPRVMLISARCQHDISFCSWLVNVDQVNSQRFGHWVHPSVAPLVSLTPKLTGGHGSAGKRQEKRKGLKGYWAQRSWAPQVVPRSAWLAGMKEMGHLARALSLSDPLDPRVCKAGPHWQVGPHLSVGAGSHVATGRSSAALEMWSCVCGGLCCGGRVWCSAPRAFNETPERASRVARRVHLV